MSDHDSYLVRMVLSGIVLKGPIHLEEVSTQLDHFAKVYS